MTVTFKDMLASSTLQRQPTIYPSYTTLLSFDLRLLYQHNLVAMLSFQNLYLPRMAHPYPNLLDPRLNVVRF